MKLFLMVLLFIKLFGFIIYIITNAFYYKIIGLKLTFIIKNLELIIT